MDSRLSVHEKAVYIAIKRLLRQADHLVLTHEEIIRVSSLSLSAVKRAIESLINKKLLIVKSNRNRFKPNDYCLTVPRSSHRPTKGSDSSSARPTVSSSSGPTFKNTCLKHTQLSIVCCSCKKSINETIRLLDPEGIEYLGCPQCHSDLVIDTSKTGIKIDAESLLNLLSKHDPQEVFKAIDVITHKFKAGENVSNFTGLLIHMLKHGVIYPESYIPPAERRRKDAYMKMLKAKEEAEKRKTEAEYLSKRLEAEKRYNALSPKEKEALRDRAKKELPAILHNFKQCVSEKMIEILTSNDKQP